MGERVHVGAGAVYNRLHKATHAAEPGRATASVRAAESVAQAQRERCPRLVAHARASGNPARRRAGGARIGRGSQRRLPAWRGIARAVGALAVSGSPAAGLVLLADGPSAEHGTKRQHLRHFSCRSPWLPTPPLTNPPLPGRCARASGEAGRAPTDRTGPHPCGRRPGRGADAAHADGPATASAWRPGGQKRRRPRPGHSTPDFFAPYPQRLSPLIRTHRFPGPRGHQDGRVAGPMPSARAKRWIGLYGPVRLAGGILRPMGGCPDFFGSRAPERRGLTP
jgi:hypothetical protein